LDELICDRFQAAFRSPRVAYSLSIDSTLDHFSLNHTDSRSFELIREIVWGSFFVVNEENIDILASLIEDFGHVEMGEHILRLFESCESLNVSNCISRLKQ
jgi:hypothetical protein